MPINSHVGTAAPGCPVERRSTACVARAPSPVRFHPVRGDPQLDRWPRFRERICELTWKADSLAPPIRLLLIVTRSRSGQAMARGSRVISQSAPFGFAQGRLLKLCPTPAGMEPLRNSAFRQNVTIVKAGMRRFFADAQNDSGGRLQSRMGDPSHPSKPAKGGATIGNFYH